MGRAKLEMKYREEARARINTYKTRIKGLEKKAEELSVLCGVDVLFTSFSPDLSSYHCWPKNPSQFHRILQRYKSSSSQNPPCVAPSPPLVSTFQEERLAVLKKLEEVRQRICFLEAEKMASSSQKNAEENIVNEENDDVFAMLDDLGEDLILAGLLPSASSESICGENSFEWNFCIDNYSDSGVMSAGFEDFSAVSTDDFGC